MRTLCLWKLFRSLCPLPSFLWFTNMSCMNCPKEQSQCTLLPLHPPSPTRQHVLCKWQTLTKVGAAQSICHCPSLRSQTGLKTKESKKKKKKNPTTKKTKNKTPQTLNPYPDFSVSHWLLATVLSFCGSLPKSDRRPVPLIRTQDRLSFFPYQDLRGVK